MATQEEIDKLIQVALQKPEPTDKPLTEVDRWIIATNLRAGTHVVVPKQLWIIYRAWSSEPISYMNFLLQMKKHFTKKWMGTKPYYLIDQTSLSLTLETEEQMKAEIIAARKRRFAKYVAKKKAKGQPEGSQS